MNIIVKNSFVAVDDSGAEYEIFIKQKQTEIKNMRMQNPEYKLIGLPWMETDDGFDVNHVSKGHYQIIQGHLTIALTSDDPNAP